MAEELFTVSEEDAGERIDQYLSRLFADRSRSYIQKLINSGNVTIDDLPVKKSHLVDADDIIKIHIPPVELPEIAPENIPLDILYEDEDILVVNKPKGMVVHPGAGNMEHTLVNAVLYHCSGSLSGINGVMRPGIVHRIDKDTTGSVIVCKNDKAHESIAAQLAAHTCERIYEGIVCGNINSDEGTVEGYIGRDVKNRLRMALSDDPENGKFSRTHYRVISRFKGYAHLSFSLETGRTHQIRVHMASLSHPLLGDVLYGGEKRNGCEGQCLHARHIAFTHPSTGKRIELDAPLPLYFTEILGKL